MRRPMTDLLPIRRALISVSDKTGLIEFGRFLAAKGVEMPITEQMVQVMYEGKDPRRACEELMTRGLKSENEL